MTSPTPDGHEYRNKNWETPFETFLRYTNQKEKTAHTLAQILQGSPSPIKILDIGSGDGTFLNLVLSKAQTTAELVLLEPSPDLVKRLEARFTNASIHTTSIDEFTTDEKFDLVLASHLFYHLPRSAWPEQLERMLSFLKPDGKLIIIMRAADDAYDFKTRFKPLLFEKEFKALTLDNVLNEFPTDKVDVQQHLVEAQLHFPVEENTDDTTSIIEFYLGKRWQDIPKPIQQDILGFIKAKNNTFRQLDGIAVIRGV